MNSTAIVLKISPLGSSPGTIWTPYGSTADGTSNNTNPSHLTEAGFT
ncbi:hypothetical protein [Paenibacillus selenitireducens]|nr:hypothetical protein [Paenibacillus selenitireducens]